MVNTSVLRVTPFVVCALMLATSVQSQANTTRQSPQLHLLLEAGLRNPEHAAFRHAHAQLPRILDSMRDYGIELPHVVKDTVVGLDAKHLPLRLRVFVAGSLAGDTAGRRDRTPETWLAVVDAGSALPIERLSTELVSAVPGGAAETRPSYFRDLDMPWGKRYLVGGGGARLRAALPPFLHDDIPDRPSNQTRFLSRFADAPLWAHIDLAPLLGARRSGALRATAGPLSTLFGISITRTDGDWTADLHWGGQPGAGMLRSFLPRQCRASSLHKLLPWKPGVAVQCNLGNEFGRKLNRSILPRVLGNGRTAKILARVLRASRGEFGVFLPETSFDDANPEGRTGPSERVILLRIDPDSGDDVVHAIGGMLGTQLPTAPEDGVGVLRYASAGVTWCFRVKQDLLVLCGSRSPETAMRNLRQTLANRERPPTHSAARVDPKLGGAVQVWISHTAGRYLAARTKRHDTGKQRTLSFRAGEEFGRFLLRAGLRASLHWDAGGFRVRTRF